MKNTILNDLLKLTGMSKTEYAIALNYSPSTISKFLSGDKFTNAEIAKKFIDNSAELFTDIIYEKKLKSKLELLFPLILDFRDRSDTFKFLQMAIEYSLVKNSDFPQLNYFHKTISTFNNNSESMYYLLIFISDLMTRYEEDINLYVNFKLSYLIKQEWIGRLKFNKKAFKHKVILSQIVSPDDKLEDISMLDFLSYYDKALDSFDFRLQYTEVPIPFQGILIPNELIMVYSFLPSNQLVSTCIEDPLAVLVNSRELNKSFKSENSFTGVKFLDFLENMDVDYIREIGNDITSIYSFIPINFVVRREDLDGIEMSELSKDKLLSLFGSMNKGLKQVVLSQNATEEFLKTRKLSIPGLGAQTLDKETVMDHLQRYTDILSKGKSKIGFTTRKVSNISAIVYQGYLCIFNLENNLNKEKSAVLNIGSDIINTMIEKDIKHDNYFFLTKDDYPTILEIGLKRLESAQPAEKYE